VDELSMAASEESTSGFDWSVFIVPMIAGLFLVAVATYNTRGETAALRRRTEQNRAAPKGATRVE
jgi:hypothetical protein